MTPDQARRMVQHAYRLLLLAEDSIDRNSPASARQRLEGAGAVLEDLLDAEWEPVES